MLNWWHERRKLKYSREVLRGGQKWLRMNRDLLSSAQILALQATIRHQEQAIHDGNVPMAVSRADELEQQIRKALPAERHSAWRENIEVFLVAAIVAMGVRTFFFQPFKIPTGSMQPTLFGMVSEADCAPGAPIVRRITAGIIGGVWPQRKDSSMLTSLADFAKWALLGNWPRDGECLFSGDHIFVDRLTYHFKKPQRGDIVVFATQFMHARGFDPRGSFYIKRAVALGGDHVEIRPPYLLVNGEILDERPAFKRIYSMADGYNGYILPDPFTARYLNRRQPAYDVPPKSVLAFGDNTNSSLDSRYWGPVPAEAIIGRAVLVYWPFTRRFGQIN